MDRAMSHNIFIRDVVWSIRIVSPEVVEVTLSGRDAPVFVPNCCASRCLEKYHEVEFNSGTLRWISYGRGGRTRFDNPVEFARLPVPA